MRESRARAAAAATGLLVVAAVVLFAVLQQPPGPTTSPAETPEPVGEAPAPAPASETVALGQRVYGENRCGRCHSIAGEGGRRSALDGVGSRLTRREIRLWIVAPQEIGPGVRKPSYDDLPPEEVEALVDYLASLTAVGR